MLKDKLVEEKIQKHEKHFQELVIRMETLNREVNDLFADLKATPEQINQFISNKANFSEEEWTELHNQRKALEEKLQREMDNIRNPQRLKKVYEERHVGNTWLFVR